MSDIKRTINERFTSASNSSNLKVETRLRGDADMMIAAGWSGGRGMLGSLADAAAG